jgi:hypothetical protein
MGVRTQMGVVDSGYECCYVNSEESTDECQVGARGCGGPDSVCRAARDRGLNSTYVIMAAAQPFKYTQCLRGPLTNELSKTPQQVISFSLPGPFPRWPKYKGLDK